MSILPIRASTWVTFQHFTFNFLKQWYANIYQFWYLWEIWENIQIKIQIAVNFHNLKYDIAMWKDSWLTLNSQGKPKCIYNTGSATRCREEGHWTDFQHSLFPQFFRVIKIQGAVSIRKTVLPGMAIPMLKIRRPNGRLIFNMEIAIRR